MTEREALEHGISKARELSLAVVLRPGLRSEQVADLERSLGAPLPASIRELIGFSDGFNHPAIGDVSFRGDESVSFPQVFPKGVAVAGDGVGNFWIVDVRPDSGSWGPVMFLLHDPPVVAIQAKDLAEFIGQVFAAGDRGEEGLDHLRGDAAERIWKREDLLVDKSAARESADPVLSSFARQVPDGFRLVDLRPLTIGSGFAWGRSGPTARILRNGSELVFAVEQRRERSLWRRLLEK